MNNVYKSLIITMYERTIRYCNACSSAHDHITILNWKLSFGSDTTSSKHKEKHFGT